VACPFRLQTLHHGAKRSSSYFYATIRAPAAVAACVLAAWTLAATIPTQTAAEGPVGTWGATDPSEAAGRGDVVPERYGARFSRLLDGVCAASMPRGGDCRLVPTPVFKICSGGP
jgi:hypothetical protein